MIAYVSTDNGKNWKGVQLQANENGMAGSLAFKQQRGNKFVGFTDENNGWIVTSSRAAMGRAKTSVYKTDDGGNTWSLMGDPNKEYSHVVTGAGFSDPNVGVISFRYTSERAPVIYLTTDGAKTWQRKVLAFPEKYANTYGTPLSPEFTGLQGTLPVKIGNTDEIITYVTTDGGKTWTLEK